MASLSHSVKTPKHAPRIWADVAAGWEQREHERRERDRRTERIAAMRRDGASEADIWAETNSWFDPRTADERAADALWE